MATADKVHLKFIYDRLVYHHGENPNYDYMLRLKEIIDGPPREPRPASSNHPAIMKIKKEEYDALKTLVDRAKPDGTATVILANNAIKAMQVTFGASSTDYITLYPTIG